MLLKTPQASFVMLKYFISCFDYMLARASIKFILMMFQQQKYLFSIFSKDFLLFSKKSWFLNTTVSTFFVNLVGHNSFQQRLLVILKTKILTLDKKMEKNFFRCLAEKTKGGQVTQCGKKEKFYGDRNFWPILWPMWPKIGWSVVLVIFHRPYKGFWN